jgi:hypothetical protein
MGEAFATHKHIMGLSDRDKGISGNNSSDKALPPV